MIFVTVGTHEQQFNRLLRKVDELVRERWVNDEVFMQIGYSTYIPKYCEYDRFLSYDSMQEFFGKAKIIISHGGTGTFIDILRNKKIPIVVPRQRKYGEHVNNHQVEFYSFIKDRLKCSLVCDDIDDLKRMINDYDSLIKQLDYIENFNNTRFCSEIENIVAKMKG